MNGKIMPLSFLAFAAILFSRINHVTSHGRLMEPAGRSSAFRYGFTNPPNYDDNQLFCGGKDYQWSKEIDGRCGVCGDPYGAAVKPNEDVDGLYVKNGVITGSYVRGDVMTTKVQVTAYHKGWFEFRLCPLETPDTKVTQECLNRTLLTLVDYSTTRLDLETMTSGGTGIYDIRLQLPANIVCERCVLQWRYNTGNSWGCEESKCCVGCGKQENFVNCADIEIQDNGTGTTSKTKSSSIATTKSSSTTSKPITSTTTARPTTTTARSTTTTIKTTTKPKTTTTSTTTNEPTSKTTTTTKAPTTTIKIDPSGSYKQCPGNDLKCQVKKIYKIVPGMFNWCCSNCKAGYCPPTHCTCS